MTWGIVLRWVLVIGAVLAANLLIRLHRSMYDAERERQKACVERKCEVGESRYLRQLGQGCESAHDVCVCVVGAEWQQE